MNMTDKNLLSESAKILVKTGLVLLLNIFLSVLLFSINIHNHDSDHDGDKSTCSLCILQNMPFTSANDGVKIQLLLITYLTVKYLTPDNEQLPDSIVRSVICCHSPPLI